MDLKNLQDKKILILGLGKEGKDTLNFLKTIFPKKKFGLADEKLNRNYLEKIKDYDVVIKSPGIPIHEPLIEKAYKENKITSQVEIFLENCPGRIIGVTGTKGKSTTSFWIYQNLKKAGLSVKLGGNIGKPVLSLLLTAKPEDIFVLELSSHQLYGIKRSPQIALLLNIYPEHGDYYRSFKEYVLAKANITKYQTEKDYFIYNYQNKLCREIAQKSKAKKIPICGEYYELNKEAVKAVASILKAPAIKEFDKLPHRLEFVGEFKKIRFYNDSLSTIPETTIFAIDTLGKNVQTIILGGFDRGQDFKNLAKKIKRSKIKNVILFPTTGRRIKDELDKENLNINTFFTDSMSNAVRIAYKQTVPGKICLLSPASASFGNFKDYKHRGDLFKRYVKKYGKSKA
jgi:UDP-N-acetylmuramoylalanine-D-glutamate ligase